MTIVRTTDGLQDFFFEQMETISARADIEHEKKVKLYDTLARHIWNGARLNLQYKQLMMKAPDIAKNRAVVLDLGLKPQIASDKTGTGG
jgi:hypothetical protein